MDANKLWMLRDFIGANKVLFKIPVYQRNYDWSETNCNRLLDDIQTIIDTSEKHFLGTIVFMASNNGGFALQEYIIIDGQQRLTTLMIMLKALSDVADKVGDSCSQEIKEQYLFNKWCDEKYKVKLKPIKSDSNQFLLMLNGKIEEMDEDSHIYLNYDNCRKRFEKWYSKGIQPTQILEAMTKLEIVEIVLTQGQDDPQVIFESINSTGLELTNSDLIRNFLLMDAKDQERLYEDYWLYIEKALKKGLDYSNLDLFFTQYLAYKTNSPVSSRCLYGKFVKLFKTSNYTQESILKELKYFADIFKTFIYGNDAYSVTVNQIMKKIRMLKQTTCYPFLLHVFDDYNRSIIDNSTLEKILQFLLSYLLRRMVCGVPSNSLRGLFIYLYNRVFKVKTNKKKYYESINKFLFTVSSKDIVPSKSAFGHALQTANIYRNSALCKFLLLDIENGDSKETLKSDNLTVEHIMPQTLNADWKQISAIDHERYLHTLGNLSVTGYNSELSNKDFLEKKNIIRENSKAVILNSDVLDKKAWGPDEIKARSTRLAKIILEHYPIEEVKDDSIAFEYMIPISLNDYSHITGKKLVSFNFCGDTYQQNKFALMLQDVIKLLDKRCPGKLQKLAQKSFSMNNTRRKHPHLNTNGENMRFPNKLCDGVYLELNLNAVSCVHLIDCLLAEYHVDKSCFSFNVVAEEPTEEEEESDEELS